MGMHKRKYVFLFILLLMAFSNNIVNADVGGVAQTGNNTFSSWTSTGDPASDMAACAMAQIGRTKSSLGYYGGWCAAFVVDCAYLTGQSEAVPFISGQTHNEESLKQYIINRGGTVVSQNQIQAGDIIFWSGHTAIAVDNVHSVHGNTGDTVNYLCSFGYGCDNQGTHGFSGGSYQMTLRPAYKKIDTVKPVLTEYRIKNITNTSYDVYLKGSDNLSQKLKFRIGTWNDNISIDDAKWQESEYLSSKEVQFTVRISDFGNAKDVTYHTNAYVIDESGNVSTGIRVGDTYIASLIGDLSCDWIETNVLPDNVTTANCEIQYNNHYQKSAASSPGSGWTKTGSGESKYDPVGEPFEQSYESATSATLKLVDYKYYHYCGHANQWVDHWQHGDYNHFCGPYNHYLFTETESKPDDGNYGDGQARYLYRVKWSAAGTAETGYSGYATCGGTGSDWYYKMYKYQRYQLVIYYNWVKDSGWTTTRDSSANSVTFRYRLKSGCSNRRLTLPAELKEINASAFEGATSFREVYIPNGVTAIGARAFANCTNLTLVRIPSSVTSIGTNAFLNDSGITLNCQSDNTTCSTYARNNNISLRIGY